MNIRLTTFTLVLALSLIAPDRSVGQVIKEKGWLYYRYYWGIVFFPVKDQTIEPTYENFFTAEKDTGYSFTGHDNAVKLLLLAKTFPVDIEDVNDSIYIQPAKVSYSGSRVAMQYCDTMLNALTVFHQKKEEILIYRSLGTCRENEDLHFLNKKDEGELKKRPRRTNIDIYPPH